MSRLARRLRNSGTAHQPQPEQYEYYEPGEYYSEKPPEIQNPQNPSRVRSPLVDEYDQLQREAKEYQQEIEVQDRTNPHTLYKEVLTEPTPKGTYKMRLFGRPVDLASLEHYLIYPISPKSVTTLMRYNDAKAIEDIKGYSKKPGIKFKSGIIWIILGAAAMIGIGLFFLQFASGGGMTEMMKGIFGM